MLDLLKAAKHCFNCPQCEGCLYEEDQEKCDELFEKIQLLCATISKYYKLPKRGDKK